MISRELFSSYAKDALASFYNPARLQTHPLVGLCVPQTALEGTKGQSLRGLLGDTLELLRPASSISFGRPEWLGYRVMRLRYIECLSPPEVCRELSLSHTSYYRYHREAVEAFVSTLWDRYQREGAYRGAEEDRRAGVKTDELAKEEAIRLAQMSGREAVHLEEVLRSAHDTIRPLVQERGITLLIDVPDDPPTVYADPAMLRQIVLNVLTEGIKLADTNALRLGVKAKGNSMVLSLRGLDESRAVTANVEDMAGFAVSRGLLEVYGGQLWFERDERRGLVLCFTIPCDRPKTVLIIDDDADTIELYRRYLRGQACIVRAANTSAGSWAFPSEVEADLILLDVLMPHEDGWDILRRLKRAPEVAKVPVVVCSVLSQPDLALSLGAAEVLQKPIDRDMLLRTVQRLLA